MCHFDLDGKPCSESDTDILCVWVLKEAEDDQQVDGIAGKLKKWCLLKKVSLNQMLVENPGIAEWRERNRWLRSRAVAIDPNDEDTLYLDFDGDIVACNFRTRTSFKRARNRPDGAESAAFHPWTYVFPSSLLC